MLDKQPYTFDKVIRLLISIGIIWGLIWILGYLSDVLIPFAVAFLLAYLLNPIVCRVQNKIPNRAFAVGITLTLTALVLIGACLLVFPMIKGEIVHMREIATKATENVDFQERARNMVGEDVWQHMDSLLRDRQISDVLQQENVMGWLEVAVKKMLPVGMDVVKGVFSLLMGVLGLIIVVLYLIFLLIDYDSVRQQWKHLIPPAWQNPIVEFMSEFDIIMNRHFRAQAMVALCVGILFAVGFSIIGMPMAILLGLFIGALNMIPYLQIVGLIPASFLTIMMALEKETSIGMAIFWLVLVFAIVQIIQDAVLTPKIMGDVTGLKPAIILLSISVWGKLLGFFGLIVALPFTCLFLAYYRRFVLKHE